MMRLAALACTTRHPLLGDATLYHDFALPLLEGKETYPLVLPLTGFYLALIYRIFGVSALVARVAMLPITTGFLAVMPLNVLLD